MKKPTYFFNRQSGMTLIELMVALTVAMVLTIAMFSVLSQSESRKRTSTTANDVSQSGAYAISIIDRLVRSAGSGFRQVASMVDTPSMYGCKLLAARASTQTLPLPSPSTPPAPFSSVTTGTAGVFRLAPILILPGQTTPSVSGATSDVLVVMAGTSGQGDMPQSLANSLSSTSSLPVANSIGVNGNDLLLLADTNAVSGSGDCMLTQVTGSFTGGTATSIPLSGTYYLDTIAGTSISSFTDKAVVANLGNVTNLNPPQFLLIGVGNNNTLFSFDLLNTDGDAPRVSRELADGVFEMRALYGIDNDAGGIKWVSPTDTTYSLANFMAGTPAAADLLQKIKAIRVGLILRTQLQEKNVIAGNTSVILFSDVQDAAGNSLAYTRTLASTPAKPEQNFRYKTVEIVIPLRNNLL